MPRRIPEFPFRAAGIPAADPLHVSEPVIYRTYKIGFVIDPRTGIQRPLTDAESAKWCPHLLRAMAETREVKNARH